MTAAAQKDYVSLYSPYSHDVHDNPYPYYKALRDNDPVHYDAAGDYYILSRFDDVQMAMRDFKRFSSEEGVALEADAAKGYPMVITMVPPKHTHTRRVISRVLTPDSVAALEPMTRAKTIKLLEPFRDKGHIDTVANFGCYLPMYVIGTMLKIPESDHDQIRVWTDNLLEREDGVMKMPPIVAESYLNMAQYFEDFVKEREKKIEPGDLLSLILEAKRAGEISHEEVIGFLMILGIAGNETTTKLIGNMTVTLARNSEARAECVANPALISAAVEETMRMEGSSQLIGRVTTEDVTLHGVTIPKGKRVGMLLVAANRDERHYENPETFNLHRNARDHMGFGFGIHSCVGAAMARMEGRVAFEEILKMMPNYEVETAGLKRMHSANVRGYTHVPVRF
ncbi:MAG TPA: cytochrome P450 [Pseudomonadales bacterium]|nr:cytochrome P450 [Pseudomonadales bacterium]